MRITNRMIAGTITNNINRNKEMLSKIQNQMSSGKVLEKPSDDPVGVGRILSLSSVLGEQEQYSKNIQDAIGWLESSESALGNVTNALERIQELTVYGINGTLSPSDRNAIALEIDQRFDELVQVANTSYGGRYIFGGNLTVNSPFSIDGQYHGDGGQLNWEVAPQVAIQVNIPGDEIFRDLLDTTKNVSDALQENGDLNIQLSALKDVIDTVLSARAVLGAKSNRLEAASLRAFDTKTSLTKVISEVQDIDMPKTVMEYKMQEAVYQAALQTGAKLIQPTLLDFLR